jgi:hypothetical protein
VATEAILGRGCWPRLPSSKQPSNTTAVDEWVRIGVCNPLVDTRGKPGVTLIPHRDVFAGDQTNKTGAAFEAG